MKNRFKGFLKDLKAAFKTAVWIALAMTILIAIFRFLPAQNQQFIRDAMRQIATVMDEINPYVPKTIISTIIAFPVMSFTFFLLLHLFYGTLRKIKAPVVRDFAVYTTSAMMFFTAIFVTYYLLSREWSQHAINNITNFVFNMS